MQNVSGRTGQGGWRVPGPSTIAVAIGSLVLLGWYFPAFVLPLATVLFVASLAWPVMRAAITWRTVLLCGSVVVLFGVKDLLTSGPLDEAVNALGGPVLFDSRQPNIPVALRHIAGVGMCFLSLPLLSVLLGETRALRYWGWTVVIMVVMLAAAVLTHPAATSDYGHAFRLGAVVSRNAAAGVFALGAVLAAGIAVDAMRRGRTWEWPLLITAAGLCVVAVVGLGSRGGLFAMVAGLAWLLSRLGGRRGRFTLVIVVVLVLAALLAAPATVIRLVNLGEEYRLELWAASLKALSHAPFAGLGGGGFLAGFALLGGMIPSEGMRVMHPDSSWVLLLTEWGVVGVSAAAVALGCFPKSKSTGDEYSLRYTASACVVAWLAAAVGDISLHRPELLVVGLPALAAALPHYFKPNERNVHAGATVCACVLAVLFGGLAIWTTQVEAKADDPKQVNDRLVRMLPLDARVHHVCGVAAFAEGKTDMAAGHFYLVSALDPANTLALHAYAEALTPLHADLALPIWRRLMAAANLRAASLLDKELKRPEVHDLSYWMRATELRPELWVMPADTDFSGAQRCFTRWQQEPDAVRTRSPVSSTLGAFARWGTKGELLEWCRSGPRIVAREVASGARLLRARGRPDLAWAWLEHLVPAPPQMQRGTEAGLKARVLANPDDHVAAAWLLDQTHSHEEASKLARVFAGRAGAPAWFRVRLAQVLKKSGRDEEALDTLLAAADMIAAGR